MTEERFIHQGTSLLFPTPLLMYKIANADQINAMLLQEIAARQQQDQGVVRSGRNVWHSKSDFFTRSEPGHKALAAAIRGVVEDATLQITANPEFFQRATYQINGWVNVSSPQAYTTPHDHPGSFWSGAYYAAIATADSESEAGGAISFLDPRTAPTGQALVRAQAFAGTHTVRPTPGTLLLFSGNTRHWVHPNNAETDRVTVAFNAAFAGRGGAIQGQALKAAI